MKLWLKVLLCCLGTVILGSLGGFVTASAIEGWYAELERPPGVPPNWVFGPVWTLLYLLMGVSLALFWHRVEPGKDKRTALGWFTAQFVLNLAWSPVFFGLHQIGIALVVIVALLACLAVTIELFRRKDRTAAVLLIPYALWVSYATYLNAGFLALNR